MNNDATLYGQSSDTYMNKFLIFFTKNMLTYQICGEGSRQFFKLRIFYSFRIK